VPSLRELAPERVLEEWRKLLLKPLRPSIGLMLGMELGVFDVLHPELAALRGTPQEPEWHPEGDVWVHSCMVVDQAAAIIRRDRLDVETAWTTLLGALLHDAGKPATTVTIDGRVRSPKHSAAGVAPAAAFMDRMLVDRRTREKVLRLVAEHTCPTQLFLQEHHFRQPVTPGAIRRLAARLAPATIAELLVVSEADRTGRGPFTRPDGSIKPPTYHSGPWLRPKAETRGVLAGPPADLIQGRDLLERGLLAGKDFGAVIAAANALRDDRSLTREQVLALLDGAKSAAEALTRLRGA
jgi:tRNA nucleotidyltransferase (CCA-adding enzyme)